MLSVKLIRKTGEKAIIVKNRLAKDLSKFASELFLRNFINITHVIYVEFTVTTLRFYKTLEVRSLLLLRIPS